MDLTKILVIETALNSALTAALKIFCTLLCKRHQQQYRTHAIPNEMIRLNRVILIMMPNHLPDHFGNLCWHTFPWCRKNEAFEQRFFNNFHDSHFNEWSKRVILACMCVKLLLRLYVCHRVHFGSILGPFCLLSEC